MGVWHLLCKKTSIVHWKNRILVAMQYQDRLIKLAGVAQPAYVFKATWSNQKCGNATRTSPVILGVSTSHTSNALRIPLKIPLIIKIDTTLNTVVIAFRSHDVIESCFAQKVRATFWVLLSIYACQGEQASLVRTITWPNRRANDSEAENA